MGDTSRYSHGVPPGARRGHDGRLERRRLDSVKPGFIFIAVGRVIQGDGIGTRLGFPTANLEPENELIPSPGVYAARALFEGEVRAAAVNIGTRPTVKHSKDIRVEAFLINFAGDLYGHHMRLDFLSRIRDEQKFKKLEDLIRQIFEDAKKAVVEAHM